MQRIFCRQKKVESSLQGLNFHKINILLFPLSIMYYKEGNYRKCKKVIKKIQESNEHLLNYLTGRKKFTKSKVEDIEINGTYSWGSEAEAYFVVKDNKYLLETVPAFIEFIEFIESEI